MAEPNPDGPAPDGRLGATVFSLGLTSIVLGPWAYLLWGWWAAGEPMTWWRLILLIILPFPGAFLLLLTVMCLRSLVWGERVAASSESAVPSGEPVPWAPSAPTAEDEAEMNRFFSSGTLFIQREDDPNAPLIPLGTLDDAERLLAGLDTPEKAKAFFNAVDGPKRPLVYLFEHVALREAAFENHPELIRELTAPRGLWPLSHIWAKARVRGELTGQLPVDSDDSDEAFENDSKLYEAVSVRPWRRDGYTLHLVTMPIPLHCPEAHFAAIVHKDDEPHEHMRPSPSTRYFTLEKADSGGGPLLCEWRSDASRENYGEGTPADAEAFAAAVYERVRDGKKST